MQGKHQILPMYRRTKGTRRLQSSRPHSIPEGQRLLRPEAQSGRVHERGPVNPVEATERVVVYGLDDAVRSPNLVGGFTTTGHIDDLYEVGPVMCLTIRTHVA